MTFYLRGDWLGLSRRLTNLDSLKGIKMLNETKIKEKIAKIITTVFDDPAVTEIYQLFLPALNTLKFYAEDKNYLDCVPGIFIPSSTVAGNIIDADFEADSGYKAQVVLDQLNGDS